ncbi:MAG TPA: pyruvate, phosphate dikinase [Paracoccaceae bacterium]|nr:pyruvate, phosphate dikinase [Paracoccaceae bacterium]
MRDAVALLPDLIAPLAPGAAEDSARFGAKAARLARLAGLGAPVKRGFVIAAELVAEVAEDPAAARPRLAAALDAALERLDAGALLALRGSPADPAWGGPPALLNLGAAPQALAPRIGERAARDVQRRLVQAHAVALGADAEVFDAALHDALDAAGEDSERGLDAAALDRLLATALTLHEEETGEGFPSGPRAQLLGAAEAMARAWNAPSARILRAARGGPETGGLALILQEMALGLGPGRSGAGRVAFRSERTGAPGLVGRFLWQAQGDEARAGLRTPRLVGYAERQAAGAPAASLEEEAPELADRLRALGAVAERALADAVTLEFTLEDGVLHVLGAEPLRRSARAAVRIAVDLAKAGALTREAAVLRVDPGSLAELLHPTLDPAAPRDRLATGLPASPGAAAGPIVFNAEAADAAAARGQPAVLVRIETSPEDIRGMHSAAAVLTTRGGMTSHAAVVARGLGTPCVVGASALKLDLVARTLTAPDGRVFREGDLVTVDGGAGEALAGAVPTVQPEFSGALAELMVWSDSHRRMAVRANADTAQDARVALGFEADGIGLCRTEHMFFEKGRITAMRRMILAERAEDRRAALERLLPMQRGDFIGLYRVMQGRPVTIRLLDPPLHEFLPHGEEEIAELASDTGLAVPEIRRRIADLQEFNPMLGKRGCRLGIVVPEIYEMQARAVFEALAASWTDGPLVRPEIMIPLVSARREATLIRGRIDAVAEAVAAETGRRFDYRVGVMVETPRAALRAGDIAEDCDFLSFGTNDLTQMTYGLSRDDAGRFMRDYVAAGVFPEDPFHTLDLDGVGELLTLATERARARRPGMSLGLCGEHGGDPASVDFCEAAGFDYVSCSPFRVPVARLAAAQAALRRRGA